MGGQVFGHRTSPIQLEQVKTTLNHFYANCLIQIGLNDFLPIGSTGKKELSSDLDVAVLVGEEMQKNDIKNRLSSILGSANVKLVGNNIAACYPVRSDSGITGTSVQIDIMLTNNLEETKWLMFGVGNGVKGVYRNLLLSYIAKSKSQELDGVKFSMAFPGGLKISTPNKESFKVTNSQCILNCLGIDCSPEEASTFESLCSFVARDESIKPKLYGFEDYISSYSRAESTREEAKKCLDFLKSNL